MSFLSEWLKEIIFIVLIAVFIDLLLPNRSMERYAKFVVSLIILLTLLSPVMKLLSPMSSEKLESAISDHINKMDDMTSNQNTKQILAQGELLREKREAEALQWTAEEAARQMKSQIQQEIGQQVIRVTVKMSAGSTKSEPHQNSDHQEQIEPAISSVEVVMAEKHEAAVASMEDTASIPHVKPVENVQVSLQIEPAVETSNKEHGNPPLLGQIEKLLQLKWGIPSEAVTVTMQGSEER